MAAITTKNTRKGQERERQDSQAALDRFNKRRAWFIMELSRQQANRYQMALDEDYYDGDQWTAEEASAVRRRGQNPVVHNEIKPMVDFLLGTERRMRIDHQVQHRTDMSPQAEEEARAKTQLLKFVDDVNRTQFLRSESADDQFKGGLGWLEVGVRADPSEYPIYKRKESWRNMLYDSLGATKMPDEWRYIYRYREVDFDIAETLVSGKKTDLLRKAIITNDTKRYMDWYNGAPVTGQMSLTDLSLTSRWTTYDAEAWLANPRERVMLIECWMSEPYRDTGDSASGMEHTTTVMRKRVALMTEYDTLLETWSPYNHGKYPFIPYWCYRRKKDGAPYGVIRQHRSPQDSINKHLSKAQFRSAVRQLLIENGAVDAEVMDWDEIEEAITDPSALLKFAKGALSGQKVKIQEGMQLAQGDMMLAEKFASAIRGLGPVSTEDRGQEPGNVSGKARAIRQEQGSRLTAEIFDNMLLARQLEGEITLSLAEQYHREPMVFSTQSDGPKPTWTQLNQRDPETGAIINDIGARKASFVIGETPWQQSLAEAAFDSLLGMMGEIGKVAPNIIISILDVVLEMHPNLPKKGLILQRIREVTGMPDPNAGPTPEMQAKQQQQAQMAAAQYEAQMAMLRADVLEAQTKGMKLSAEAMAKRLETLYMAAQAAQVLTMAPVIAPVADELARSVGFQDMAGDAPLGGPVPTAATPALPAPQQADGALAGAQAGIQSPAITGVQPPQE